MSMSCVISRQGDRTLWV